MASLRLLMAALLVAMLAAQTPARKKAEKELQASIEAPKGDFDYLLGEWEFTSVSNEHRPAKGFWTADRSTDGGKTASKENPNIEAHRIGLARPLGALARAR